MNNIPTVLTAQELLDKAFRRVDKVRITDLRGTARARAEAQGKVSALAHTIAAALQKYVRAFPSLDRVHPFERELIDVTIGLDRLRHSLGAIDWARKTVEGIQRSELARIKAAGSPGEITAAMKSAFGRISSVVKRVAGDLEFLNHARDELRSMPSISPEERTVVVAGCPNVGKSRLVAAISSGKPEVAAYPFTTRGVSLGHLTVGYERVQVMDTPGLLDRPLEERNPIELQAVAALKHLADIILFVIDPTETCGYTMEEQESLLAQTRDMFPEVGMLVVCSKADLAGQFPERVTADDWLRVSAESGEGMERLLEVMASMLMAGGGR